MPSAHNKTQTGSNPAKSPPAAPRLIFVGENKFQEKKAEQLAKTLKARFMSYSEEEWATLEEIDQYIQDEEVSKQIITLPAGRRAVSSLDEVEAETIKKVMRDFNGNKMKTARALKIARATLYRKMERYGLLNFKKQKEELEKRQKSLKKAA